MAENTKKTTDFPVQGFPMKFTWQDEWNELFDEQVKLIKEDINRARVQGRMVIYLSCPISSRGGGYSGTNVEITEFTRMRLLSEWGTDFWILNPAMYQMESKAGTGLMFTHARNLWKDKPDGKGGVLGESGAEEKLKQLLKISEPSGGDYMRMWTQVLVKDGDQNLGYHFDGFYFLAPSDVKAYFLNSDAGDLTSSVNNYFARKYASDAEFRDYYTVKGIQWGANKDNPRTEDEQNKIDEWEKKRKDFFRFYALKAGMNYSLGGHDEWNIWVLLNGLRIEKKHDIGELIPGFFEGKQIAPGVLSNKTITGYEVN